MNFPLALLLAQADDDKKAFAIVAAVAGIVAIFAVIGLIINAVICYFISSWLGKVPAAHRKLEPGLVWLLMIPCFPVVWNFFVFLRVPESFKSYFDAQGRTDVGDCGRSIGLAYAICVACSFIPFVNYLTGPASLVLLIISLVKFNELKNKIV